MPQSVLNTKPFSPKRMLKGETFLKKERISVHNALFLPIAVVSSFFYYGAHTDIDRNILLYMALIFGIFYYILARLIFNYRLQKHLEQTVTNYQFRGNLWCINWKDEALQKAWQERLLILANKGELTEENLKQIINCYKNRETIKVAYIWLILLISASLLFCMLLATVKSHHKLADVHKYRRRHLPMSVHYLQKQTFSKIKTSVYNASQREEK